LDQAVRAMVDGVHCGNVGGKGLRRANVGRGFVPANVLLPGLQRQPVGLVPVRVPETPGLLLEINFNFIYLETPTMRPGI
jgi:hypothetical protein